MNDGSTDRSELQQMPALTLEKDELSPSASSAAVHKPVKLSAADWKSFRGLSLFVAIVCIFLGAVVGSILRLASSSTAAYAGMGVVFGLGFLLVLVAYSSFRYPQVPEGTEAAKPMPEATEVAKPTPEVADSTSIEILIKEIDSEVQALQRVRKPRTNTTRAVGEGLAEHHVDIAVEELDAAVTKSKETIRQAVNRQEISRAIIADFVRRMHSNYIEPMDVGFYRDGGLINPLTARRLATFVPEFRGWPLQENHESQASSGLVVTIGGKVMKGPNVYFCDPAVGPFAEATWPLRFTGLKKHRPKFAFTPNHDDSHFMASGAVWVEVHDSDRFIDDMAEFLAANISHIDDEGSSNDE